MSWRGCNSLIFLFKIRPPAGPGDPALGGLMAILAFVRANLVPQARQRFGTASAKPLATAVARCGDALRSCRLFQGSQTQGDIYLDPKDERLGYFGIVFPEKSLLYDCIQQRVKATGDVVLQTVFLDLLIDPYDTVCADLANYLPAPTGLSRDFLDRAAERLGEWTGFLGATRLGPGAPALDDPRILEVPNEVILNPATCRDGLNVLERWIKSPADRPSVWADVPPPVEPALRGVFLSLYVEDLAGCLQECYRQRLLALSPKQRRDI
jgi:hypothetical protein